MFHTVKIEGYRGFTGFEMGNLGCINLLVGKNNSGKTSVLEALHLLGYGGDLSALWQLCGRRGERFSQEPEGRYIVGDTEIDISHLFTGHELQVGSKFTISARNEGLARALTFEIAEPSKQERAEQPPPTLPIENGPLRPRLVLRIHSAPPVPGRAVPLTRRGGIHAEYVESPRRAAGPSRRGGEFIPTSHFISSNSLTGDELVRLWDRIQLKPQEKLVLEALRFIDPRIEHIRATGAGRYYGDRGGFIIKRNDYREPFPLGSLGDGAWRMLAMAIVVTQCRDGVLLVDEIDTGLHYTVMADMWKLIFNAAREFNVQVFAATHSYDCVYSLATICRSPQTAESRITIQRIEAGRQSAVPYTEAEIRTAAEHHIEMR